MKTTWIRLVGWPLRTSTTYSRAPLLKKSSTSNFHQNAVAQKRCCQSCWAAKLNVTIIATRLEPSGQCSIRLVGWPLKTPTAYSRATLLKKSSTSNFRQNVVAQKRCRQRCWAAKLSVASIATNLETKQSGQHSLGCAGYWLGSQTRCWWVCQLFFWAPLLKESSTSTFRQNAVDQKRCRQRCWVATLQHTWNQAVKAALSRMLAPYWQSAQRRRWWVCQSFFLGPLNERIQHFPSRCRRSKEVSPEVLSCNIATRMEPSGKGSTL